MKAKNFFVSYDVASREIHCEGAFPNSVYFALRKQIKSIEGDYFKVPFPPLSRMRLPEFSQMEKMQLSGITYKDTFFVSDLHQTESLYFHELVHVVQWNRLGVDNFLLAYGAGLIRFGYRNSPLEKMAYSLQASFDCGNLSGNTVEIIRQQTDAIWNRVSTFISTA